MPDKDNQIAIGDEIQLEITDMAYGGDAVGRLDSSVVFAWGGIKGETSTVEVERVKGNIAWGSVVEVDNPSPERIEPPCPYFGPCGGCQWQHISYPGQAGFKRDILAAQLQRSAGLSAEDIDAVLEPTAAMDEPWGYRNVAHFQVDAASHKLGYFRRESRVVVPVDFCPISEPGINRMLVLLQDLFSTNSEAPGDLPADISEVDLEAVRRGQMPVHLRERKTSGGMKVWQVTVRVGRGEDRENPETVIVMHSLSDAGEANPRRVRRNYRAHPTGEEAQHPSLSITRRAVRRWIYTLEGPVTIVEARSDGSLEMMGQTQAAAALDVEDGAANTFRGAVSGSRRSAAKAAAEERPEQPPGVVRLTLAGQEYHVAPTAFFQVNSKQAERMIELVAAAIPQQVNLLLDAYSGVGAFALALLKLGKAKQVVAIESDWSAVESARWTLHLMNIGPDKLRLESGRVEAVLPGLKLQPDVVLLDPPRTGCATSLITYLVNSKVPKLIYVSCDPSTLARDIKMLAPAYRLVTSTPVDMFPQTYHIESVSVLERIG